MSLRTFFKVSEKYIVDNAPTILSAVAVTGTLGTAYLTGKATIKAVRKVDDEIFARVSSPDVPESDPEDLLDAVLSKKEIIKLVWPLYIPPALAAVGTIGCIVTANSLSAKRIAAMAALYKISEDHLEEYRDKVKEKLGLKDESALRDEINQDKVNSTYDAMSMVGLSPEMDGKVWFLEAWTGRYFRSTMAQVKSAENKLNRILITENYGTLSEFYSEIDLDVTQESSEIGWSLENPLELNFTVAVTPDDAVPVHVMEYSNRPHFIRDYGRMR